MRRVLRVPFRKSSGSELVPAIVAAMLSLAASSWLVPSAGAQTDPGPTPGYFRADPGDLERSAPDELQGLDGTPGIVIDGDRAWFRDRDGARFPVFSNEFGDFVIETPVGLCFVDGWLLQDFGIPSLKQAFDRIEVDPDADTGPDAGIRAHLWWQPLVGHALVCDQKIIECRSGAVWIGQASPQVRDSERQELFRRARELFGSIDDDDTLRTVLGNVLSDIVDESDRPSLFGLSLGIPSDESPDLPRSTIHRLIRHGWLQRALASRGPVDDPREDTVADSPDHENGEGEGEDLSTEGADSEPSGRSDTNGWIEPSSAEKRRTLADALQQQLESACQFQVVRSFLRSIESGDLTGPPAETLLELRDAFGRTVWTKTTPGANHLAVQHPAPGMRYGGNDGSISRAFVEYRFPKSVDPLAPEAPNEAESAQLLLWGRRFATMEHDRLIDTDGFEDQFTGNDWSAGEYALEDGLPPHLAMPDARGDLRGLALPEGTLWFDDVPTSPATFLERAAVLLKTPHQIDLLGQYAFRYASDSPDNERPELIGTVSACGDRQSSALETISRARGAEFRGDCDDYSALCAAILELQGVPVIQFGTPGHVSAVWVVEQEDSATAYLVQTGPTLQFDGDNPIDALATAYRHLDSLRTFDPLVAKAVHQIDDLARPDDVLMPVDAFFDQHLQDLFVAVDLLRRQGRFGAAGSLLDDALTRAPDNIGLLVHRAQFALTQLDHQRALECAVAALATDAEVFEFPAAKLRAEILQIIAATHVGRIELADRTERRLLGDSLLRLADVENPLNRLTTFWELGEVLAHGRDIRTISQLIDATILTSIDAAASELDRRKADPTTYEGRFAGLDTDSLRSAMWQALSGVQAFAAVTDRGDSDPVHHELEERFLALWAEQGFQGWDRYQLEPACAGVFAAARRASDEELPERLRSDGPLPRPWLFNDDIRYGPAAARALTDPDLDWRQPIQTWLASSPAFWAMRIDRVLRGPRLDRDLLARLDERLDRAIRFCDQNEAFEGPMALISLPWKVAAAVVLGDEEAVLDGIERLDEISRTVSPLSTAFAVSGAARHASLSNYRKSVRICSDLTDGRIAWAVAWLSLWAADPEKVRCAIEVAEEHHGPDPAERETLERSLRRVRAERAIRGDS